MKCTFPLLIPLLLLGLVQHSHASTSSDLEPGSASKTNCVIVLHGLGRSAYSMTAIENALTTTGYSVWNESYDSRSGDIPALAGQAVAAGLEGCRAQDARRFHFVSHSLGGILIRQYFQTDAALYPGESIGRIVMLSPPNGGSEVIDLLGELAEWLGPAAKQLAKGKDLQLQAIPFEVGVITGNRTSDPWFSPYIPGPDDGKVSVESAKLAEMKDFLVLPVGHTFIVRDAEAIRQAIHFLAHGRFERKES